MKIFILIACLVVMVVADDINEIRNCEQETTTQACEKCCHVAHFHVPLEEASCAWLCRMTHLNHHGNKRQLSGIIQDVNKMEECQKEATTDACIQCCHSAHFRLPLGEGITCDTMCRVRHHDNKRQLVGIPDDSEFQHCTLGLSTGMCIDCCHFSYIAIYEKQRRCTGLCPGGHHFNSGVK